MGRSHRRGILAAGTGMATAEDPAETLGALMRRADEALYQAKSDGRNRVVAAPRSIAA